MLKITPKQVTSGTTRANHEESVGFNHNKQSFAYFLSQKKRKLIFKFLGLEFDFFFFSGLLTLFRFLSYQSRIPQMFT